MVLNQIKIFSVILYEIRKTVNLYIQDEVFPVLSLSYFFKKKLK